MKEKPENKNYNKLDTYAKEMNYEKLLKLLNPLIHKFKVKYNKLQDEELAKELIQCGRIGLFEAMQKHDPTRGAFFNTAYTYIKKEMLNHLQNNSRTIRIPVNQQTEAKKGFNPKYPTNIPMVSLDTPVNGTDDMMLTDILGDMVDDNSLDDAQLLLYKMIQENLFKLRPKQRDVVWMYVIEEKTYDEIVEVIGTTRQNICQIYNGAIKKLRKMADAKKT